MEGRSDTASSLFSCCHHQPKKRKAILRSIFLERLCEFAPIMIQQNGKIPSLLVRGIAMAQLVKVRIQAPSRAPRKVRRSRRGPCPLPLAKRHFHFPPQNKERHASSNAQTSCQYCGSKFRKFIQKCHNESCIQREANVVSQNMLATSSIQRVCRDV